jgi:hypothetical protein
MGLLRRAVPLALLLATACASAGPARDPVLSAAGSATPEVASTVVTTIATTTTVPPTSTTVRRTTTTTVARPAPSATRPPATPTPPIPGYSPAPPPAGVVPDGYGGYGGLATTTADGATIELSVYPREQYFGEPVQVRVEVTTTEWVAVTIDMGNGTSFENAAARSGTCSGESGTAGGGAPFYVYPAPGQYRIRAIVTLMPCLLIPGPPGSPAGAPSPFDHHTVEAAITLTQRADRPPPPVGPPPGR